jgi:hypothetical protein
MVYDASDPANRVHCRLAWAHPSEALAPATAGNTTASGTGKRTRGYQLQIYYIPIIRSFYQDRLGTNKHRGKPNNEDTVWAGGWRWVDPGGITGRDFIPLNSR